MAKRKMSSPPGFEKRSKPTGSEVAHRFAEQSSSAMSSGPDWFKFPQAQSIGDSYSVEVRILPAWTKSPSDPYWFDVHEHFGEVIGPDGFKRRRGWVCRESVAGEKCPAEGQKIRHYMASKAAGEDKFSDDAKHYKLARSLSSTKKTLVQVLIPEDISRHGASDDLQPTIMRLPTSVWKKIQSIETHKGNVSCWEWGMPLRIIRKKTGNQAWNVEYDVLDMEREPLDEKYWSVLGNLHDLSAVLEIPTREEEMKMLADAFPLAYKEEFTAPKAEKVAKLEKRTQVSKKTPPGFQSTLGTTGGLDDDIPF